LVEPDLNRAEKFLAGKNICDATRAKGLARFEER
jgi:hypothetical protein